LSAFNKKDEYCRVLNRQINGLVVEKDGYLAEIERLKKVYRSFLANTGVDDATVDDATVDIEANEGGEKQAVGGLKTESSIFSVVGNNKKYRSPIAASYTNLNLDTSDDDGMTSDTSDTNMDETTPPSTVEPAKPAATKKTPAKSTMNTRRKNEEDRQLLNSVLDQSKLEEEERELRVDRREERTSKVLQRDSNIPKAEWVQCESCKKWRRLPSFLKPEILPDRFYCEFVTWDKDIEHGAYTCEVEEETEDKYEVTITCDGESSTDGGGDESNTASEKKPFRRNAKRGRGDQSGEDGEVKLKKSKGKKK